MSTGRWQTPFALDRGAFEEERDSRLVWSELSVILYSDNSPLDPRACQGAPLLMCVDNNGKSTLSRRSYPHKPWNNDPVAAYVGSVTANRPACGTIIAQGNRCTTELWRNCGVCPLAGPRGMTDPHSGANVVFISLGASTCRKRTQRWRFFDQHKEHPMTRSIFDHGRRNRTQRHQVHAPGRRSDLADARAVHKSAVASTAGTVDFLPPAEVPPIEVSAENDGRLLVIRVRKAAQERLCDFVPVVEKAVEKHGRSACSSSCTISTAGRPAPVGGREIRCKAFQ